MDYGCWAAMDSVGRDIRVSVFCMAMQFCAAPARACCDV